MGKKVLSCHQGKDGNKMRILKKSVQNEKSDMTDHSFRKKRKSIQPSKKSGCPVTINIRHYIKFTDYKLQEHDTTQHSKSKLASIIKQRIATKDVTISMEHCYIAELPDQRDHKFHLTNEIASLNQPMDLRLKMYIKNTIHENVNVTSASQMKTLLEVFVKQVMFKDQELPPLISNRFWPSLKDIRNHMMIALKEIRGSSIDQRTVADLVLRWQTEHPADKFKLRLKEDSPEVHLQEANSHVDDKMQEDADFLFSPESVRQLYGSASKFLFVHQTSWQRRILQRYGNEICLLDATYRTTRYSLPLFFLCVPTNCSYMVVGTFIVETEDSVSIGEALNVLKEWNPDWGPKFFMCDHAEEEISAIETVFEDAFVYLCDFHREQSWERWLNTTANGCAHQKDEVLRLIRNVARSTTEAEFNMAKQLLLDCNVWIENPKFRNWFQRYWLNKYKRWVVAFRQDKYTATVNTTNGVERQNKSLKYDYLEKKKTTSLSQLLVILIENFLPDSYKKYLKQNASFTSMAKPYAQDIPSFLHNRPRDVVERCYKRWIEAGNIPIADIEEVAEGTFFIRSQTEHQEVYSVNFNSGGYGMPSCDCIDWKRSLLPCKHFMAIFRNFPEWNWDSLPEGYRCNPFLNADMENFPHSVSDASPRSTDNNLQNLQEESVSCPENFELNSLPVPSVTALKRERSKVTGLCQILREHTYHCKDTEVLMNASESLKSIITAVRDSLEKDGCFILQNGHTKQRKKKRKQLNIKTSSLCSLPKRKKYFARRSGESAARKRKHTSRGVQDILDAAVANETTDKVKGQCEADIELVDLVVTELDGPTETVCTQKDVKELSNEDRDDIQARDVVDKLWSLGRDLNVPVAKVNGQNVYDTDIRSLRSNEWLTDMVLDSYMSILATARNDIGGEVIHYSQTKMTSIIEGKHSVRKPKGGRQNANVPEVNAKTVMGIYHTVGHWTLVIVEMEKGLIYYYNPTGEHWTVMRKIGRNWAKYIDSLREISGASFRTEWKVVRREHVRQTDSCNCGVYCLIFAERHLNSNTDFVNITKNDITEARLKIAKDIMLYEVYLDGCCPRCGFAVEDDENIQCRQCSRMYHFKSFCLDGELSDIETSKEFVCRLCISHVWPRSFTASKAKTDGKKEICKTKMELRKDRKKKMRSSFLYEIPVRKTKIPIKYCVCNQKEDGGIYWQCENCTDWFHPKCVGESEDMEPTHYVCGKCKERSKKAVEKDSEEDLTFKEEEKEPTEVENLIQEKEEPAGVKDFTQEEETDSDSDEEDKLITSIYISKNFNQLLTVLGEILSCDDTKCTEMNHQRHHQFCTGDGRNKMMETERKSAGYGYNFFSTKSSQLVLTQLIEDLVYSEPDKRGVATLAKRMLVRGVPKSTRLYKILFSYKMIALKYIEAVLWKEALAFLVALKTGMPLEAADEKCQETVFKM